MMQISEEVDIFKAKASVKAVNNSPSLFLTHLPPVFAA